LGSFHLLEHGLVHRAEGGLHSGRQLCPHDEACFSTDAQLPREPSESPPAILLKPFSKIPHSPLVEGGPSVDGVAHPGQAGEPLGRLLRHSLSLWPHEPPVLELQEGKPCPQVLRWLGSAGAKEGGGWRLRRRGWPALCCPSSSLPLLLTPWGRGAWGIAFLPLASLLLLQSRGGGARLLLLVAAPTKAGAPGFGKDISGAGIYSL
jgi:hypothetical protein